MVEYRMVPHRAAGLRREVAAIRRARRVAYRDARRAADQPCPRPAGRQTAAEGFARAA